LNAGWSRVQRLRACPECVDQDVVNRNCLISKGLAGGLDGGSEALSPHRQRIVRDLFGSTTGKGDLALEEPIGK